MDRPAPPPKPAPPPRPPPPPPPKPASAGAKNPLIVDHADPGTFYHEGWFYTAATGAPGFPMQKSRDLKSWQGTGPALRTDGRTGAKDFWAPNFTRLPDGSWLLVYTADRKLYLAKAAAPTGPYSYLAGPLLGGRWAIDGQAFVDPKTSKTYLYWNQADAVWAGELRGGAVVDDRAIFGSKSQPEPWVTEVVNEAPFVFERGGTYYCCYSGNATGPKYGVGYATAKSPLGPWKKSPANPVLWGVRGGRARGTGHCSVARVPGGAGAPDAWLMFYHAQAGGTRDLYVDAMVWAGKDFTMPGAPSAAPRLPVFTGA